MDTKLADQIIKFMNSVGDCITMEYDKKYYTEYVKETNQSNLFDFVGSYYLGGNNVPDTARYVVEFIKMNLRRISK